MAPKFFKISKNKNIKKLTRKKKIIIIVFIISFLITSTFIIIFLFDNTMKLPKLYIGDEWWYEGYYNDNYIEKRYDIICYTRINSTDETNLIDTYEEITKYYDEYGWLESHYNNIDKSTLNPINSKGNTISNKFDFPLKGKKSWIGKWKGTESRTFKAEYVDNYNVPAGSFKTYRIEVFNGSKVIAEYYYSDDVRGIIEYMEYDEEEKYEKIKVEYSLTKFFSKSKDSDNDYISNMGEKILKTDPDKQDSDSDGIIDSKDIYPYVDLKIQFGLNFFSIDGSIDDRRRPGVLYHNECDPYFIIFESLTLTFYQTETIYDSDEIQLNILWEFDYPDNKASNKWIFFPSGDTIKINILFYLFAFDEDSRVDDHGIIVGDDNLDINDDEDKEELEILFNIRKNEWMIYPFRDWANGEGSSSGSGNDENDATVTFEMRCNIISRDSI